MYLFLGGDKRILETYNMLKTTDKCEIFGFQNNENTDEILQKISIADVIILPVPYTRDNKFIFAPYSDTKIRISDISDNKKNSAIVFYGTTDRSEFKNGINILDIPEYKTNNAFLTSEILIDLITGQFNCDLKSNILITGYGKIAKNLIKKLSPTAKKIYVAVRNRNIFEEIKNSGCIPADISELNKFHCKINIIINTVPYNCFSSSFFEKFKNVKYFDIASYPHGTSIEIFNDASKQLLLGLPGKYRPFDEALFIHKIIKDKVGGDVVCSKD